MYFPGGNGSTATGGTASTATTKASSTAAAGRKKRAAYEEAAPIAEAAPLAEAAPKSPADVKKTPPAKISPKELAPTDVAQSMNRYDRVLRWDHASKSFVDHDPHEESNRWLLYLFLPRSIALYNLELTDGQHL
jgi:hypothetical protein